MIVDQAPSPETSRDVAPVTVAPKTGVAVRAKRADID
jgi:hypothetical protein